LHPSFTLVGVSLLTIIMEIHWFTIKPVSMERENFKIPRRYLVVTRHFLVCSSSLLNFFFFYILSSPNHILLGTEKVFCLA
jgi:hypothetical protein